MTKASDDDPARERGDAVDFDAVYQAEFAFVWRNLRRLGVPEAGLDDATQDVFLVLHRRLAEAPVGALRPWLYGVARRVAADHRRTLARRGAEPLERAEEPAAGAGSAPERRLEQAEAARLVRRLLDRLPEEQREVFMLVELEQMSAPEIAEAIGVPVNTVYSRLRAARAAFEREAARLVERSRER